MSAHEVVDALKHLRRVRSVERTTVTRITTVEGRGTGPGDAIREVVYWYDDSGIEIARFDPMPGDET